MGSGVRGKVKGFAKRLNPAATFNGKEANMSARSLMDEVVA